MAIDIGEPNAPYSEVQIPSLDDAADIRAALRTYHYGSNVSDPFETEDSTEKFENSIANILQGLSEDKRNINIELIPSGSNLNQYTTPGVYCATLGSIASGSNYPAIGGARVPGILYVESYNNGGTVVQQYITTDTTSVSNSVFFVRTKVTVGETVTWAPANWSALSDSLHDHDERYTQTRDLALQLEVRPTQINGKNASGADLTGTRKIVVAAPITVEGKQVPNITPLQQSTLQPGDIWFW
jgi:uncharacterized protein YraI